MGGTITVKSEMGRGSLFKVIVPLPKADETFNKNSADPVPIESLTLPTMLLGLLPSHRLINSLQRQFQSPSNEGILDKKDRDKDRDDKETKKRGLMVLMVEDNLINQKVGTRLLKLLGITDIEIANDGRECLRLIEARIASGRAMYDLILMDKQMPNLDGLEATRMIRKLESERGLLRMKIIALTADCRSVSELEVKLVGMDDYISKPVTSDSIRAVLAKHGLLFEEIQSPKSVRQ